MNRRKKKEKNVQKKKSIHIYIYILYNSTSCFHSFLFPFKPTPMNELEKIKRRKNLGNMHIEVLYTQS